MSDKAFSRRNFLKVGAFGAVAASTINLGEMIPIPQAQAAEEKRPQNADEALKKLMEGNKRFLECKKEGPRRCGARRREVAIEQKPYAVILACADSRVAPEVIFDQGIGDLFVVRVAGNIVNPTNYGIQGSLEYGVVALGAPLIMVLGHSECGAVDGAIDALQKGTEFPGSIDNIVKSIEPAVEKAKKKSGDLLYNSIIDNVQLGVYKLKTSDTAISEKGDVAVLGAYYDLKTGEVKLLG